MRLLPPLRLPDLLQALVRVDRHLRLLVGEQQPVPVLFRKVSPRDVDVDAEGGDDAWTLYSEPRAPTVQYEHTVVVTRNGPLVVTLPG